MPGGEWFGCLFCATGRERDAARKIEMWWPGVKARAVSAVRRRTSAGVKYLEEAVILPGYVFFRADDAFEPTFPLPEGIWRIVRTVDGDCRLTGRDQWFARWMLDQDGVIGLSAARQEGTKVRVQQGPLKDLEGYIVKIDRRNRSGQIALTVNGRELKVWLGFEWLEDQDPVLNIERAE